MLSPDDRPTHLPQRITVAGVSGSGKTTLCRRLAAEFDLPWIEIDSLHHGPGWRPRPAFVADVDAFTSGPRWVIEWQYTAVRDLIADRAELLVWLDLPTPVTLAQLTRRTLVRRLRRTQLWNGNTEAPLRTLFTDPEHILRWGFRTRNQCRALIPVVAARRPHLSIVRLTSRREIERWLRTIRRTGAR